MKSVLWSLDFQIETSYSYIAKLHEISSSFKCYSLLCLWMLNVFYDALKENCTCLITSYEV